MKPTTIAQVFGVSLCSFLPLAVNKGPRETEEKEASACGG